MSKPFPKETKAAAQSAYLSARSEGHTKEEARSIRDNWKSSSSSTFGTTSGDEDDDYFEDTEGPGSIYYRGDYYPGGYDPYDDED
jgi:hypothetical protein